MRRRRRVFEAPAKSVLVELRRVRLFARWFFFFFQAEDGIRDKLVTGVQTCALPISSSRFSSQAWGGRCTACGRCSGGWSVISRPETAAPRRRCASWSRPCRPATTTPPSGGPLGGPSESGSRFYPASSPAGAGCDWARPPPPRRPTRADVRSLLGLSAWYSAGEAIAKVLLASDVIILGILVSPTAVASYVLTGYAARLAVNIHVLAAGGAIPGIGGVIGRRQYDKAAGVRYELLAGTWLFATPGGDRESTRLKSSHY